MSSKDLPWQKAHLINIRHIWRIHRHPVESDNNSAPANISVIENYVDWNGDLDTPNDSKHDWEADMEWNVEPNNSIADPECPE